MASKIDPSGLLRRYHAAVNALDFDAIGACFAENARYGSNGIGEISGRAAIMASFRRYFARHGDQTAGDSLVEDVSANAARAVWWLRATDSETGSSVERRGEEIVTFDADGLIIRVDVTDT